MNLIEEYFDSNELGDSISDYDFGKHNIFLDHFQVWFEEKMQDFAFASRFMIKFMAENYHPHCTCIIDGCRAEVFEGIHAHFNDDYIQD